VATNRTREPLRGAIIAILAAAIGAGGTLIGNQLASVNARTQQRAEFSHDDSARRQESQQGSYTKFTAASKHSETDLIIVLQHDFQTGQPTSEKEFKEVFRDEALLYTAWSDVQTVGSIKAAALATEVLDTFDEILQLNNPSPKEVNSQLNVFESKLKSFVDASRTSLIGSAA
jgi:hypothetical protein